MSKLLSMFEGASVHYVLYKNIIHEYKNISMTVMVYGEIYGQLPKNAAKF